MEIKYDSSGRMTYNPTFHSKQGKAWTIEELKYIIDFYDFAGSEEISFALERTPGSIIQKVNELRRKGIMHKKRAVATAQNKKINKNIII